MKKQPKRILHCVVTMDIGGAETLIMNLYRNIDRNKVQFDFLTSLPGAYDEEIEKLGGKIYRIPYYKKVGMSKYYHSLLNFFEHNHYDIVHSHMDCMSSIVLKAAKKKKVSKRIAHSHNTNNSGNIIVRLYKNLLKLMINRVANVRLACSNEAGKWLFGKNKEYTVIKNGIEMSKFFYNEQLSKKHREKLNISEDAFVLGHVGRFDNVKNHKFIIEIFNEIRKIKENSYLLLIGDGSLRKTIEEKVVDYNLEDKTIFTGKILNAYEYYSVMDSFVFPSFYEGLPLTLIEAQTCGLKCFISDNITNEVMITNLIEKISLEKSAKQWAEIILESGKRESIDKEKMLDTGFDITSNIDKIMKIYFN